MKLVLATVSMESPRGVDEDLGAGAAVAALCELTGREGADDALKRWDRCWLPKATPRPLRASPSLSASPPSSSCVAAAQAAPRTVSLDRVPLLLPRHHHRHLHFIPATGLLRGEAAQELMQRLGAHDASSALSSLDRLEAQQRDYKRIFARFEQQMKGFSNVSEELAMMSEGLGGGGAGGGTGYEADIYPRGAVGAAGEAVESVDALEAELAAARAAEEVRSAGARGGGGGGSRGGRTRDVASHNSDYSLSCAAGGGGPTASPARRPRAATAASGGGGGVSADATGTSGRRSAAPSGRGRFPPRGSPLLLDPREDAERHDHAPGTESNATCGGAKRRWKSSLHFTYFSIAGSCAPTYHRSSSRRAPSGQLAARGGVARGERARRLPEVGAAREGSQRALGKWAARQRVLSCAAGVL